MGEKLPAMLASALVGSGFLIFGCISLIKNGTSRKWPQVAGTITQSVIKKNTGTDSNSYDVLIQYEYAVNIVRYTGEQEMGSYVWERSAQAAVERYAVNSSVVVYYDPEKPTNAVLKPSYTAGISAIAAAIVFLLLAARLAYELTLQ
jgi:uncharacterized protein DUF3592